MSGCIKKLVFIRGYFLLLKGSYIEFGESSKTNAPTPPLRTLFCLIIEAPVFELPRNHFEK